MNVLDLYRSKGMDPKKVASTHGGEYCGPCPGCGGRDRFRVWPQQNAGQGSFFCRGCNKAGDRITFLMEFDGKSYPEACRSLDIKMEDQAYRTPAIPGKRQTGKPAPQKYKKKPELPPDSWMDKAEQLISWAHNKLLENDEQLAWLAHRGIDRPMVEKFRLGWNPGKDGRDLWRPRESWGLPTEMKKNKKGTLVKKKLWIPRGLVIPFLRISQQAGKPAPQKNVGRIRVRRLEGEPRYYVLPGSAMDMMVLGDEFRACLILESELDGIMCHALAGDLCTMVALGSSSAKPDEKLMENLRNSAVVLLSQDYDAAGAKAMAWWKHEFHQAKTWPVPEGTDPGEAYQAGTDIRAWISAGFPAGWRVGQSLLGRKKRIADEEPREKKNGTPDPIAELARLLKAHPVTIHNTSARTYIAASLKWQQQNWEIYKRISALVFLDLDVFRYISAHPAAKIDGKNIEPRMDTDKHG